MKKVLLLTLLALSITACGGTSQGNSSKDTSSENTSSKDTSSEDTSSEDTSREDTSSEDISSGADMVTIKDLLDRENTIDRNKIKRVACIGAGALRLYSYIGDMDLLCGAEDIERSVGKNRFEGASRPYFDLYQEQLKELPSIGMGGPAAQYAEPELLLEVNPDIIISEYEDVKKADDLQNQIKVPVFVTSYGGPNPFSENIKKSLTMLGEIFNKQDKATSLISYINSCKEELNNNSKDAQNKPSMYVGCLGNWGRQSFLSTNKSYIPFGINNIDNAAKDLKVDDDGKIDLEALIAQNPDKIILDAAGVDLFIDEYKTNKELYNALDAINNGEVYLQMAFNVYYTNLEIALMNCYYIASIAYPETYKNFALTAKYNEITKKFLGEEMYDSIIAKPYSYGGYQKIDLENFPKDE